MSKSSYQTLLSAVSISITSLSVTRVLCGWSQRQVSFEKPTHPWPARICKINGGESSGQPLANNAGRELFVSTKNTQRGSIIGSPREGKIFWIRGFPNPNKRKLLQSLKFWNQCEGKVTGIRVKVTSGRLFSIYCLNDRLSPSAQRRCRNCHFPPIFFFLTRCPHFGQTARERGWLRNAS